MLKDHAQFSDGSVSVEAGLMDMLSRMETGRFRVFQDLNDWFEEFRLYHRKDGRVVKERDDLMSATRYAVMMLRHARTGEFNSSSRRASLPKFQNVGNASIKAQHRSGSFRDFGGNNSQPAGDDGGYSEEWGRNWRMSGYAEAAASLLSSGAWSDLVPEAAPAPAPTAPAAAPEPAPAPRNYAAEGQRAIDAALAEGRGTSLLPEAASRNALLEAVPIYDATGE